MNEQKTAFDYGRDYAEFLKNDNEPCDIVDYNKTYPDIPYGDYCDMVDNGIEANAREYWKGFNSIAKN